MMQLKNRVLASKDLVEHVCSSEGVRKPTSGFINVHAREAKPS